MATNRIETLIGREDWKSAQSAIQKRLNKEPDDHWLWSRLSTVKYELRDYQGALDAAARALEIVPDCPLALWSYAGALDMLDRRSEAVKVYVGLIRKGRQELREPDEDANECWEGADWTRGLVVDCFFRLAGCLATAGRRSEAAWWYRRFLAFLDLGACGIYTREEAVAELRRLAPSKGAGSDELETAMKKAEQVMSAAV